MKTQNIAKYGMLIALAFIFSYIEAMIPVPMPAPGMKLGLANLVSVVGLYTVGVLGTVGVALIRIVLVGFTFGNAFSMWYGLAGGITSLVLMLLCKRTGWFSILGVSVVGGIGHNLGQLLFASWTLNQKDIMYYFPVLAIGGLAAGAVIGILGGLVTERIKKGIGSIKKS